MACLLYRQHPSSLEYVEEKIYFRILKTANDNYGWLLMMWKIKSQVFYVIMNLCSYHVFYRSSPLVEARDLIGISSLLPGEE